MVHYLMFVHQSGALMVDIQQKIVKIVNGSNSYKVGTLYAI